MTHPILREWYIHYATTPNGYSAPEQRMRCATGRVYNSYRADGTWITTSQIGEVTKVADKWFLHTRHTVYQLDNPSPDFIAFLAAEQPSLFPLNGNYGKLIYVEIV